MPGGRVRLEIGRLESLTKATPGRIEAALDALAVKVLAEAQSNIVRQDLVDTGGLLNSGTTARGGRLVRYVGFGKDYAPHHEFGTRRHRARPYLRPALKAAEPLARELFGKVITT